MITFTLSDGIIHFPRDQIRHPFFRNHLPFLKTDTYQFDVTTSEFLVILAYLVHQTLPPPGKYSEELRELANFLLLDDLHDFLISDVDYFLSKIDPAELEFLDSKELTLSSHLPNHQLIAARCSTRIDRNLFCTSKPPMENIEQITGMDIDWDVFLYHTEFPVRYFNGGVFYSIAPAEEAIQRLLASPGISKIETEDHFTFFKKGSRFYRIALQPFSSLHAFLATRNDCDAYFYGKNQGDLNLWYGARKRRFIQTQYNLYDPRYADRQIQHSVSVEFVGTYERNRHLISDFL